ncbi:MAG: hypothetical protein U0324_18750 [Polyangiales bacterium]
MDGPDAWVPPPPQEQCNGFDDDRDGMTDEDDLGAPCPLVYGCRDPAACRCAPTHTHCQNVCFERSVVVATATCRGVCVFLDNDNANCGACGNRCPAGMRCSAGRCVCAELTCNGVCTRSDAENCGACGRRCPAGATCYPFAGIPCQCELPSLPCGPGGACVTFSDDNCGGCGMRCPFGTRCTGASCAQR